VRVGIVDVGANTLRLLVAASDDGRVTAIREERVQLSLGEEIEAQSEIGEKKLEKAAATVREHVRKARKLGCAAIEVLVTSPGRQAENGGELVRRLAAAGGVPTRVLTAEEESELAWAGALAFADRVPETVAVCDVGGGSAQIAVGTPAGGPTWVRSVDLGSLRLTRRAFRDDPPGADDLARAHSIVREAFAEVTPPQPLAAIAVGGSARALRRVTGELLGEEELLAALRKLTKRSSRKIVKDYGVDLARAKTMTAKARRSLWSSASPRLLSSFPSRARGRPPGRRRGSAPRPSSGPRCRPSS
jgi:exopolyphosphatase/guanosine-5'-triphosphate,3'-diphosphate pyrophosphatase